MCARVNRRTCVLSGTTHAAHTSPHVEEGARPLTSSPPFSDNMVSLCATSPWIAQSPYSGGMKQLFAETLQERITDAHNQTPPSTRQNQDQNGPPGPHHLREQVTYPLVPKRCREIRMKRACDGASLTFAWPFCSTPCEDASDVMDTFDRNVLNFWRLRCSDMTCFTSSSRIAHRTGGKEPLPFLTVATKLTRSRSSHSLKHLLSKANGRARGRRRATPQHDQS